MDLTYKWNIINKKTSKQNITRNIEINNKLTVTRGEGRRITGENREGPSRNMYKEHMDKAIRGRFKGMRRGWVEWGAVVR